MARRPCVIVCFWLLAICSPVNATEAMPGLLAQWDFDEGAGEIAADATGNGHEAAVFGATWVKQADGYALSLDGLDDYVACTSKKKLAITGPVSFQAWIKPMAKSQGLASLFGSGLSAYFIGYYAHAELVYWFIGSGGNKLYDRVNLRKWNHVATSFDGERMILWLNGREVGNKESAIKEYKSHGALTIGTKGRPDLPKYRGLVDKVRVYNRGLSGEEVVSTYHTEAVDYGIDPAWFNRVKATPYFYFDRKLIVVEVDYKALLPLRSKGRLEVNLVRRDKPDEILQQQVVEAVPIRAGMVDVSLPIDSLAAGDYALHVRFDDGRGTIPLEKRPFSYPPKPAALASPMKHVVPPIAPKSGTPAFEVRLGKNGGFRVNIKKSSYPFNTRISWPNGEFNRLVAGDSSAKGEEGWKVQTRKDGDGKYLVTAAGAYYQLRRNIEVFPTHVSIKDQFTNTTNEDLGLLVYNELPIDVNTVKESRLGGFERGGRLNGVFCPSAYLDDGHAGVAMLPIDDVFVIQAVLYRDDNGWGIGTEQLALAPGKSYTLQWAVYPTQSGESGDGYYDFVNTFRHVEGRIGTIDGALGFFTHGPKNRDQIPTTEYLEQRNLKYGLVHGLAGIVDDPTLSVQGVEFVDFPKERQRIRKQMDAIKAKHPNLKVAIHIAHSLYCTNQTDRYDDSQVISENGDQAIWNVPFAYISEEKQKAGWKFWIFYPTPGNKFHDVMLRSVDVLRDDMHVDGGFMDGFFAGYKGKWTHDGRWDGYSATIDLKTKTITKKAGSVLLLSQPSMIAYTRKMRDRGGFIIANNTVVTRSIANEKYIIHDSESGAGPQLHLAPTVTALAGPGARTRKDVYLNMLENLRWGELYIFYGSHFDYPYKPLAARQYPMTFEEIREGLVRGPERIVTMNSGAYGWPGKRNLHLVYKYDDRGAAAAHDYITTADTGDVRTQVTFSQNESAVIEPIPVVLDAAKPVNVRVVAYDADGIHLQLNGGGKATLQMNDGVLPVSDNRAYQVITNGTKKTIVAKDAALTIPLSLQGMMELLINPQAGP